MSREKEEQEEGDYDLTGYGKGLSIVFVDDLIPSSPLGNNFVSVHNGCKVVPRVREFVYLDRVRYTVTNIEYTFSKNECFDLVTSGAQKVYVHIVKSEF